MFDKPQSPLIFGVRDGSVVDIRQPLSVAEESNLHFCCVPLFNRRLRRDHNGISLYRDGPGTRSDRELESRIWITNVVGEISDWIDCDNTDAAVRKSSETVLREEFSFGCHLGLQALVLPAPSLRSPNYAAIVQQLAAAATYQQLWVRIPLVLPLDFRNARLNQNHVSDGWECWDSLRFLTGHHSKLFVALEITEDIPDDMNVIRLWAAEPLKAIILPTRIFLENKNGYPVLPKQHQDVLILLMRMKLHIIFSGRPKIGGKMTYYIQYIQHLHSRSLDELTEGEKFTIAYKDTLQSPLQPLMDNLESQTYETFERDPVKYERYEEAIRRALIDLKAAAAAGKNGENNSNSGIEIENSGGSGCAVMSADDTCTDIMNTETEAESEAEKAEKTGGDSKNVAAFTAVVTVVGAGRGPLVAAALSAASKAGVPVTVFAVEKNANAVVTLRNRVITEMWSNVTILAGDMRMVVVPQLADILVSELLGSWGDNELSPECLDGAQRFLKEGGISIPCSYTSFVAPLSSSKLWMSARAAPAGSSPVAGGGPGTGLDTPYVVKLHSAFQVADTQPLFRFEHPNNMPPHLIDNSRFEGVSFDINVDHCTIHGFAGTFECVLYQDVMISIAPQSHTEGMFSWFPLFIPLRDPVRVNRGEKITANFWRCVDARKVWYEWCLSGSVCTAVQNSGGKSYWIGL